MPSREDIDGQTLAGLAVQSEQSVVSTTETTEVRAVSGPSKGPLSTIVRRVLVVGYNDATQLRERFVECLADGGALADCEADSRITRQGESIVGVASSPNLGDSWNRTILEVPAEPVIVPTPPVPVDLGTFKGDPWLAKTRTLVKERSERVIDRGPDRTPIVLVRTVSRQDVYYAFIGSSAADPDNLLRYLVIARSEDGGRSFPQIVAFDTAFPVDDPTFEFGCGSIDRPTIDVDRSDGPSSGRVYASWAGRCVGFVPGELDEKLTARKLPLCDPSSSGDPVSTLHTQVQLAPGGRPYVVVEEANGGEYQLCLHTMDDDGTWRTIGPLAEHSQTRGFGPTAEVGPEPYRFRGGPAFSFDIDQGGKLVVAYVDVANGVEGPAGPILVNHIFVEESEVDANGDPVGWERQEITPARAEFQLQPAVTAEGDRLAVSFYETVSDPGEAPDDASAIRPIASQRGFFPGALWVDYPISPGFDACGTAAGAYFGDYMGIATVDLPSFDRFFSAYASSQDGCEQRGPSANTFHQHTYGTLWF